MRAYEETNRIQHVIFLDIIYHNVRYLRCYKSKRNNGVYVHIFMVLFY